MGRFPFARQVGDLLASGIHIEPEQEELLDAPGGRPMVAVWSVPDPMLESGDHFWVNGRPVVIPVVLENCTPDEDVSQFIGPKMSLVSALTHDDVPYYVVEEALTDPKAIAEIHDGSDYPYKLEDFEVMEGHYGRQLFDVWPIDTPDIKPFQMAVDRAINDSGYMELVDFFNWENGYYEPESDEEVRHVLSVVEDASGNLKGPDEFRFELHLPPEHRYTWERLQDLSQQGWLSYGMTLPKNERQRLFNTHGSTPWF